jgi:uncharacterized protein
MIRDVSAGHVRINDEVYRNTVALTTDAVLEGAPRAPISRLTVADLRPLLDTDPDMILLGTGEETQFAPRELLFALARAGVGLEVMTSAAAARTFNVLASEERRVAAVIYV